MAILNFIFSGFWIFWGVVILLSIMVDGIVNIIKSIGPSRDNIYNIDGSNIDVKEFLEWKENKSDDVEADDVN